MKLTQAEKERYLKKPSVAGCTMFNYGGIEIKDITFGIEDYVIFVTSNDYGKLHTRKIYYMGGRSYFRLGDMRIYLDECIRY